MSHSPEPWSCDLGTLSISDSTGKEIFRSGLVYGTPSDEAIANVLLAAAAPELLEAAEAVLGLYPGDSRLFYLWKVIEKAKGGIT